MEKRSRTINNIMVIVISSSLISLITPVGSSSRDGESIDVTSPDGGETLFRGDTVVIEWSTTGEISNVGIDLCRYVNHVVATIVGSTTNDGEYTWTIPYSIDPNDDFRVQIHDEDNSYLSDSSESDFCIDVAGTIEVTSPNGEEVWSPGKTYTIAWDWSGDVGDNVKIEYALGGGVADEITGRTSNDGEYSWSIPTSQTQRKDYTILVTSLKDELIDDFSDNYFTIGFSGQIEVSSPNGGETWILGSTYTITWTSEGSIGDNVKIELYHNDNVRDLTITSSTLDDGSYSWSIPSSVSAGNRYKIKIFSVTSPSIYDASDNEFTIGSQPKSISVISPDGGENWLAGSSHDITWTYTTNTGANVKIELYSNDILSSTLATSTSNDGRYPWTIPTSQSAGSKYKVKITSLSESSVFDLSDGYFSIGSSGTPPTGEPSGTDYTITEASVTSQYVTVTIKGAYSGSGTSFTLVNGNGVFFGKCIEIRLVSNVQKTLNIKVELCQLLVPRDSSNQKMVITEEVIVSLSAKDAKTVSINAMCFEMHMNAPNDVALYGLGSKTSGNAGKVVTEISRQKTHDASGQCAIWAVTDNAKKEDLANYGATDSQLRKTQLILDSAGTGIRIIASTTSPTGTGKPFIPGFGFELAVGVVIILTLLRLTRKRSGE